MKFQSDPRELEAVWYAEEGQRVECYWCGQQGAFSKTRQGVGFVNWSQSGNEFVCWDCEDPSTDGEP